MEKDSKYKTAEITNTLMNISEIMNDGCKFFIMRMKMEKFEKEALEGNESSIELVNMVKNFEKLITILSKRE